MVLCEAYGALVRDEHMEDCHTPTRVKSTAGWITVCIIELLLCHNFHYTVSTF